MKTEIKINDNQSIDILLYKTQDGMFVVEAIEWLKSPNRQGRSGSRELYQEFDDEGLAKEFYDKTCEEWK